MKKVVFCVLCMTSLLFAQKGDYRDYIKGSISINSINAENQSDSLQVQEDYGGTLQKTRVDLLLFENYYQGLKIGFEQSLNDNGEETYIEKGLNKFALRYETMKSKFNVKKTGTVTIKDYNDNDINTNKMELDRDFERIELKYFLSKKKNGWLSFRYDKLDTGVSHKKFTNKGTFHYYFTDAKIETYSLFAGVIANDYELPEGPMPNRVGISFGVADIQYSETEKSSSELTYGLMLGWAYKTKISTTSSIVLEAFFDVTNIAGELEYGTLGLRGSLTF